MQTAYVGLQSSVKQEIARRDKNTFATGMSIRRRYAYATTSTIHESSYLPCGGARCLIPTEKELKIRMIGGGVARR